MRRRCREAQSRVKGQPGEQPLRFDDRAAYRAWVAAQPRGRWERSGVVVVTMTAERLRHTRIKCNCWEALKRALAGAGSLCEATGDGVTVEVGDDTDYEPDVLVNCGERVSDLDVVALHPVVIVEVLSPSTQARDMVDKLADYFRVPSVQHYLLVSSQARRMVRHSREEDGRPFTAIHAQGTVPVAPPGASVSVEDIYAGTELVAAPGG